MPYRKYIKRYRWQIGFGFVMILICIILNYIHYLIYNDVNNIFQSTMTNLAFLPVYILFVVIILEEILNQREKLSILEKLNIVIGTFFSNMGTNLLAITINIDRKTETIREKLNLKLEWTNKNYLKVKKILKDYESDVKVKPDDLKKIYELLSDKKGFLLHMLENPYMVEHESFTELLMAIFHLLEELASRDGFDNLPPKDIEHLEKDIERVCNMIILEWLNYLMSLKKDYPYLHSLAVRRNPFNENASAVISQ
ncbi:MAG: hypothetical protein PHD97_05160 [Bacteroidales bacterium]|nr:hypothetical protein [Bacteroidales bacterium]